MADKLECTEESNLMSDSTLNKLIDYLKTVEQFTDSQVVKLLEYISK